MHRALYVGKFQPFHLGHKKVVKELDNKYDEIVIVIGGAEKTYDKKYLFTAGERIQMIRKCVDLESTYIIPIRDINNNAVWTQHINQYTPNYDYVYSNNPLVRRLYKDSDSITLKTIDMYRRDEISGTKIRHMMIRDDDNWKNLVPDKVVDLIESFNGVDRIQELTNKDIDYS